MDAGLTVRTFTPGKDAQAVYQLDEEASIDKGYHAPLTFEQWAKRMNLNAAEFDPDLWFLACRGDEIAGVALNFYAAASKTGWIDHLSVLREWRNQGIGKALLSAGDSGEFYTPRPVVKLIVYRVRPKLGEKILDPACGTGGFLVEAYKYLKAQAQTAEDERTLQNESLFGVEKKPLPFLLGTMNLLLHGVETPNISRDNALRKPLNEIGEKDRYEVIVTNPPFGGEEEAGIQLNFPESTRASETALLFMQFIMRSLKPGGRCGMVVPNGTLFGDGVSARIKEQLLRDFNLHTIVRLPNGVFAPYTSILTNLLFFDRPSTALRSAQDLATDEIWFYEHTLPEGVKNYTKTRPMTFEEFAPLLEWWDARVSNERAWKVKAADLMQYDANGTLLSVNLDVKNPSRAANLEHLPPAELAESIAVKEKQILGLMDEIKRLLVEGA